MVCVKAITDLVRNKDQTCSLFLLGILRGVVFERRGEANTKRPDMGGLKKTHAAKARIKLWNRRRAAWSKSK